MTDAERIKWVNFREKVGYSSGKSAAYGGKSAAYGGKMTEAERIKWVIEMIEIFKNTEEKK